MNARNFLFRGGQGAPNARASGIPFRLIVLLSLSLSLSLSPILVVVYYSQQATTTGRGSTTRARSLLWSSRRLRLSPRSRPHEHGRIC
jgi:hypothetical protein